MPDGSAACLVLERKKRYRSYLSKPSCEFGKTPVFDLIDFQFVSATLVALKSRLVNGSIPIS